MQVLGLQSSTHQPEDLLRSTEEFLCGFAKNFKNKVSKERVNLIRHMLISSLKRQKQAASDEEQTSWITSAIEIIRSVTYEKICSAAEICFSAENKKRIAILVEGQ
jgi:hypothetical protein